MKPWQPLVRRDEDPDFIRNPDLEEVKAHAGLPASNEIWMNDLYQVSVVCMKPDHGEIPPEKKGLVHLSVHRHDRHPVADWRHMQQIKNEVMGPDRWALEVYPPEEFLVDAANEYHLWVLPEGHDLPFAYHESLVTNDEQVDRYNKARDQTKYKGRQRKWQPGLTTGRNEHVREISPEDEAVMNQITATDKDA